MIKKSKTLILKGKLVNTLMLSGGKSTAEKHVLKTLKLIQKSYNKNSLDLFKTAIVNSVSTFKLNKQSVKKGKKKAIRVIPLFLTDNYNRIQYALKLVRNSSKKNKNGFSISDKFSQEIFMTSNHKSNSVSQRMEIQKQISLNKRYLNKFRW